MRIPIYTCSDSQITIIKRSINKFITSKKRLFFILIVFSILGLSLTTTQAQDNLTFLGNLEYEQGLNDIWGYADDEGNEYALVGTITGLSIVDVTDPEAPVELFFIEGPESTWRDIKTAYERAYVVNEEAEGMLIVDLSELPNNIDHHRFNADSLLWRAHNIYIDENNFAYVPGFRNAANDIPNGDRGFLIFDLNENPDEPKLVGTYSDEYVHDVYVRDDIAYTSEVYTGEFAIVDVSDKASPTVLARQSTPNNFTHNAWISDDGSHIFTTDETGNAFVGAYNISNINEIYETDRIQSSPGESVIPHNVHVKDDFVVTSYYADGIVIFDANDPNILVQTERYDTSPNGGTTFNGCWGAYPFLPSGNILGSDRQEGLFVLAPTYKRAGYLKGTVADSQTGESLKDVTVRVLYAEERRYTDIFGNYKVGHVATEMPRNVRFSKFGYETKTVPEIPFEEGATNFLNVTLDPVESVNVSVTVYDAFTGETLEGVDLAVFDENVYLEKSTSEEGIAVLDGVLLEDYTFVIGKWGYKTKFLNVVEINSESLVFTLEPGYYDDFFFDFDWETEGDWTLSNPLGTTYESGVAFCNPAFDYPGDFGNQCYTTGQTSNELTESDVDNETVTLTSPVFDLSEYEFPALSCAFWFCTDDLTTTQSSASLYISNGTDMVLLEEYNSESFDSLSFSSDWIYNQYQVKDWIDPTNNMFFQLSVTEDVTGDVDVVTEAGLDFFSITGREEPDTLPEIPSSLELLTLREQISVYPNPFSTQTTLKIPAEAQNHSLQLFDASGRLLNDFELVGDQLILGKNFMDGIYYLSVFDGQSRAFVKLLKVE